MPDEIFSAENDVLLLPFLAAETEIEAEDCLNRLFEETVIPQIRRILIAYRTLLSDQKDEIQSDAQACVLGKLRVLRDRANLKMRRGEPIKNLAAYVSTVTFNCRRDFILSRQTGWRRVDYRLRRLQDEPDAGWHFFTDAEGSKLVGLKTRPVRRGAVEFEEIVARVREKYPRHLFLKTQEIAPAILEIADGALSKNELIKAILEITDEANYEETELPEEMSDFDGKTDDEYFLEKRQVGLLRQIFDEITTFPAHQRKALLLSLKEEHDVEAISLLLKKRIASITEIAAALGLSLEEFSEIFARLPMSSSEIAEFLGIEDGEKTSKEKKVDNLRSIARNLLRRRLKLRK